MNHYRYEPQIRTVQTLVALAFLYLCYTAAKQDQKLVRETPTPRVLLTVSGERTRQPQVAQVPSIEIIP